MAILRPSEQNEAKPNMQIYMLNELQWFVICATGKQSNRLTDLASYKPALT